MVGKNLQKVSGLSQLKTYYKCSILSCDGLMYRNEKYNYDRKQENTDYHDSHVFSLLPIKSVIEVFSWNNPTRNGKLFFIEERLSYPVFLS